MGFIKKLANWMDEIEEFDQERKNMRRKDRLGEVDYSALQQKEKEKNNKSKKVGKNIISNG